MVGPITSLFMASCLADIPVFFGYSVTRIRRFGRILYISLAFSVLFFLLDIPHFFRNFTYSLFCFLCIQHDFYYVNLSTHS